MVCDQTLGNGLSDSVNLRDVTTTGDLNSDIDVLKLVQANQSKRLVNLESQDFRLNQSDGRAIHLDQTLAGLDVGDGGSGLLLSESLAC